MKVNSPTVDVSLNDAVVTVRLTEADRRNPLSLETMRALTAGLNEIAEHADARAVVIEAAGPVFSAGHDLRQLIDRTLDDERAIFRSCTELIDTIQSIP